MAIHITENFRPAQIASSPDFFAHCAGANLVHFALVAEAGSFKRQI
jgi:hypothetical protein